MIEVRQNAICVLCPRDYPDKQPFKVPYPFDVHGRALMAQHLEDEHQSGSVRRDQC